MVSVEAPRVREFHRNCPRRSRHGAPSTPLCSWKRLSSLSTMAARSSARLGDAAPFGAPHWCRRAAVQHAGRSGSVMSEGRCAARTVASKPAGLRGQRQGQAPAPSGQRGISRRHLHLPRSAPRRTPGRKHRLPRVGGSAEAARVVEPGCTRSRACRAAVLVVGARQASCVLRTRASRCPHASPRVASAPESRPRPEPSSVAPPGTGSLTYPAHVRTARRSPAACASRRRATSVPSPSARRR